MENLLFLGVPILEHITVYNMSYMNLNKILFKPKLKQNLVKSFLCKKLQDIKVTILGHIKIINFPFETNGK